METRVGATISAIRDARLGPRPTPTALRRQGHPRCTPTVMALVALSVGTPPGLTAQAPRYPATRTDTVVDDYFGTPVPAPYRWLEDTGSAEVRAWLDGQADVTGRYVTSLELRNRIEQRIRAVSPGPVIGMPKRGGDRVFYSRASGAQEPLVVLAQGDGDSEAVTVLDGPARSLDGTSRVTIYRPSRDGRYLAYQTLDSSTGTYAFHVRDLTSGRDLPDLVNDVNRFSSVSWTLDDRGFVYDRPKPGMKAGQSTVDDDAYYHVLGSAQSDDLLLYSRHDEPDRGVGGGITASGRYLIMNVWSTGTPVNRLYHADLGDPLHPDMHTALQPLPTSDDAQFIWLREVRDTLYILTDESAPNRRVIAVPLGGGPDSQPRVVVPEGPDRMLEASIVGGRLAILYMHDAASEIRLFTLEGRSAGEVELPDVGTASTLAGEKEAPELFYQFSSPVRPTAWYRYDVRRGTSEPFVPPRAGLLDPDLYETREEFYESGDGTRVPIFITARKGIERDGSHPTVLAVYGAVGFVMSTAAVPGAVAIPAWLEMGGIYAQAAVRGGGEYGEAWHRAGMRENKQNGVDDVLSAAEHLEERGYSSAEHLAVVAFSAGALVAVAAVTQRPELFAAVYLRQGVVDPLRVAEAPQGRTLVQELGSARDSTAFPYLYAYAPLAHIRPRVCYPSLLADVIDGDWRAGQSHELVARLQSAQSCDRPVLLYTEHATDRGAADPARVAGEAWAFLARETGLEGRVPSVGSPPPGAR